MQGFIWLFRLKLTDGQTARVGAKVKPVMVLLAIGWDGADPRCPASWHGASFEKPPFNAPPIITVELELVLKLTFSVSPWATV